MPIVVIRSTGLAGIGPEVLDDPGALWGKVTLVHIGCLSALPTFSRMPPLSGGLPEHQKHNGHCREYE
ncbi:MAG: hypothetical protein ACRDTF_14450 [Pseudonocardiaceae bacterium]